jgi:hypothetical protein
MKPSFIFILLISSVSAFAQKLKNTKVTLSITDCRTNDNFPVYRYDTVLLFKLPENTLAFRILLEDQREFPIRLNNVPIGNYSVQYRNIYRQKMIQEISLSAKKENLIHICSDTLFSYPQNTLTKLQNGDTISIGFMSQGCFSFSDEKIVITKKEDHFVAVLSYSEAAHVQKKGNKYIKKGGTFSKSIILTERNIKDFLRFENELNYIPEGGCTTTDYYDIRGKYLTVKKKDESCRWDGFYFLKKSFFGNLR